jgi:anthranilate synthase component 2
MPTTIQAQEMPVNPAYMIIPLQLRPASGDKNPAMIVLIDNYDSFTYNLVQYLGGMGVETSVHRNDKVTVDEVLQMEPKGIVISPGPSDPDHAGICLGLINAAATNEIPLLGVCLGHQCIGQAMGGKIVRTTPMHGKTSKVKHDGQSVFEGLPNDLEVTRYHSLVIEKNSLPVDLMITAETDDGIIMGVAHKTKPLHGVQFHPESIATQGGHDILKNFTKLL